MGVIKGHTKSLDYRPFGSFLQKKDPACLFRALDVVAFSVGPAVER